MILDFGCFTDQKIGRKKIEGIFYGRFLRDGIRFLGRGWMWDDESRLFLSFDN